MKHLRKPYEIILTNCVFHTMRWWRMPKVSLSLFILTYHKISNFYSASNFIFVMTSSNSPKPRLKQILLVIQSLHNSDLFRHIFLFFKVIVVKKRKRMNLSLQCLKMNCLRERTTCHCFEGRGNPRAYMQVCGM